MLNKFNQWSSLKLCVLYDNTNKYHYKCINKQFILYTSKNIFKNLFIKSTDNDIVFNNSNLLIDASLINNKHGVENVSINPEYTKKNGTKISFITNTDKIFLSVTPFNINEKEIDYDELNKINSDKKQKRNEKKNNIKNIISENIFLKKEIKNIKLNKNLTDKKVKLDEKITNNTLKLDKKITNNTLKLDKKIINNTFELDKKIINNITKSDDNKKKIIKTTTHDVMTIQSSLNNINVKFNNIKTLTLTGDLGYLSNKKYNYKDNIIQLITPIRKNQKNKIKTVIESEHLKQRYKIENGFCLLKKYERIVLRKDIKINTFMSFLYITCSIENNKIIKKLNKK